MSHLENRVALIEAVYGYVSNVLVGDDKGCSLVGHTRLIKETRSEVVGFEGEVQIWEDSCSN